MNEPYPITEVQEEWALERETMGSKRKFWYRQPGDGSRWLFKYPRGTTGEHWAEKIAEAVASHLQIRHARVELAVFNEMQGSATESFVAGDDELVHGNQILAERTLSYDPDMRFNQSDHTLENIWLALDRTFVESEDAENVKRQFAGYVILDAVIGNTDRHHENWGVVRKWTQEGWVGFLAHSFDHASSLGRELKDERRDMILVDNSVGGYSEGSRARGGIYWTSDAKRAPSPLGLARLAIGRYPDIFRSALESLNNLSNGSLSQIVDQVPDDWMSEPAKRFSVALMCYNLGRLREVVQC